MDSDDKNFFLKILDGIEKRLEKIENHQQKTCDELDGVDKNVIALKTSFDAHVTYNEKTENREFSKKINHPQWILVILGIAGTMSGLIAFILK